MGTRVKNHEDQQTETITLMVPSHPRFLYVVRSAVYPLLIDAGFSRKETRRIVLGLDEACSNIIKHAYGGDPTGTISLRILVSPGGVRFELRDTGRRVDPAAIAPRNLSDVRPGGLGVHFIHSVFETVRYDTSGQTGTLLVLEKKKPQGLKRL